MADDVLLLHGFPQDHREWDLVRPLLRAAGLSTVAPDQRGYSAGARPADVADYRPALLAEDAVALMDGPFHLVGHDWGAVVAWQVAATYPERVRSLTALSVPHVGAIAHGLRTDPRQREMFRYQDMLAAPGDDDAVLTWMRRALSPLGDRAALYLDAMRDDPGRLAGARNWYRAHPGFEAWAATMPPVAAPATFVWGTRDGAISATAAHHCAEWVTGAYHFIELDGANHWLPETAPYETAEAIVGAVTHCSEPKTS